MPAFYGNWKTALIHASQRSGCLPFQCIKIFCTLKCFQGLLILYSYTFAVGMCWLQFGISLISTEWNLWIFQNTPKILWNKSDQDQPLMILNCFHFFLKVTSVLASGSFILFVSFKPTKAWKQQEGEKLRRLPEKSRRGRESTTAGQQWSAITVPQPLT